jgi:hypothetical protein
MDLEEVSDNVENEQQFWDGESLIFLPWAFVSFTART